MPDVSIIDEALHLRLTVRERVLSLVDEDIAIPLSAIARAYAVPDVMAELRGEGAGARIPGLLAIGTWTGYSGGRTYADLVVVHQPGPGVVLNLIGRQWGRVLIGSDNPHALLAELDRPRGERC